MRMRPLFEFEDRLSAHRRGAAGDFGISVVIGVGVIGLVKPYGTLG